MLRLVTGTHHIVAGGDDQNWLEVVDAGVGEVELGTYCLVADG